MSIRVTTSERFVDSPRGATMRHVVVVIWINGESFTSPPQPDDARAFKLCAEVGKLLRLASGET